MLSIKNWNISKCVFHLKKFCQDKQKMRTFGPDRKIKLQEMTEE